MIHAAIARLGYLCDLLPPLLNDISKEAFTEKPRPDKWSRLQILGHLVDSAANNHQRFVRVQFEQEPLITYDPDLWNNAGYYQAMEPEAVIAFWALYNRHLQQLLIQMQGDMWQRTCNTGGPVPVTLAFLAQDYVDHMEHHLQEIVSYE